MDEKAQRISDRGKKVRETEREKERAGEREREREQVRESENETYSGERGEGANRGGVRLQGGHVVEGMVQLLADGLVLELLSVQFI